MKKLLASLLSAVMVAGMCVGSSAYEQDEYTVLAEKVDVKAYSVINQSYPECATGQLLTGTLITNAADPSLSTPLGMFDGDQTTSFSGWWNDTTALVLDQAYELTEIRVAPATRPEVQAGWMFGLRIQGSNDGENWVDIIWRLRDSLGEYYQIYTPTIEAEKVYTDQKIGGRKPEAGSVYWRGTGSYSMYRVFGAEVGEIEFYGNPAPATPVYSAEDASKMNFGTTDYYPGNIHEMPWATVTTVDGSLAGTIIGAGGAWSGATYDKAFNGKATQAYDPPVEGPDAWVGMRFDEPYALTEVRVLPKRGANSNMANAYVQGSLDGRSWRTLAEFTPEDVPAGHTYVTKTVTDTNGYTYFRYVSAGSTQSSIADLLLFGAPAAAAEPFDNAPLTATRYVYDGELRVYETKNVVTDNEISGYPIGGRGFYSWSTANQDAAFDGNIETGFGTVVRLDGPHYWVGLKADEPTYPGSFKVYVPDGESYFGIDIGFQGSVDGVNWVDLATYNAAVDERVDGWIEKTVSSPIAFNYFRLIRIDTTFTTDNFAQAGGMNCTELKIYAGEPGETAAPETAAPETEAPETAAPETEALVFFVPTEGTVDLATVGTVITSGEVDVTAMHDGKIDASVRLGGSGEGFWYGIALDQPAILDCVRVSAVDGNGDGKTDAPWNIFKTVVEGSNDGENWERIMYLGDPYSEYEDYAYWYELGNNYFIEYAFDGESDEDDDMTDPVAYKYFRVWNDDGNDNWGEVEFWGTPVAAPQVIFDLADADAYAGDTVEIEITANGATAANSYAIYNLTYDADVLTFVEFTGFGDLVLNSVFGTGAVDNAQQTIMFALANAQIVEGAVAKIKFAVNENAALGTTEVSMSSLVKFDDKVIASAVNSAVVTVAEAPVIEEPTTIVVSVAISSTEIANSYAFVDLTYDSALLNFVGFGEVGANDLVNKNAFGGADTAIDEAKNTVIIGLLEAEVLSGKVCDLIFTVKGDDLEAAEAAAKEVKFGRVIVKNNAAEVDGFTVTTNAAVKVPYLPGDINCDTFVDIQDALYLFRSATLPEMYPMTYAGSADFVADGSLDIQDALYLFRYTMVPDMYPIA